MKKTKIIRLLRQNGFRFSDDRKNAEYNEIKLTFNEDDFVIDLSECEISDWCDEECFPEENVTIPYNMLFEIRFDMYPEKELATDTVIFILSDGTEYGFDQNMDGTEIYSGVNCDSDWSDDPLTYRFIYEALCFFASRNGADYTMESDLEDAFMEVLDPIEKASYIREMGELSEEDEEEEIWWDEHWRFEHFEDDSNRNAWYNEVSLEDVMSIVADCLKIIRKDTKTCSNCIAELPECIKFRTSKKFIEYVLATYGMDDNFGELSDYRNYLTKRYAEKPSSTPLSVLQEFDEIA